MARRHVSTKVIPLMGMAVTLAIAYGLDRWIEALERMVRRTFHAWPLEWVLSASNLLLAGSLLTLWWLVNLRSERGKFVSWVFLIVGLFLTFGRYMVWGLGLPLLRFLTLHRDSRLAYAGAFIAVIGMFSLIKETFGSQRR